MQIESTPSAVAHIVSEAKSFRLEADVNIYNGKASEINNGRVYNIEDEMPVPVAEFSSYTGSTHLTWYGQPDTEAQVKLLGLVNDFCNEVRAKDYLLTMP